MNTIKGTLSEREGRYGSFYGHALVTQNMKDIMRESRRWESLTPDQREALEMIVHKIGRIVNGDPNYADSWHDIAGYALLVEQNLLEQQGQVPE